MLSCMKVHFLYFCIIAAHLRTLNLWPHYVLGSFGASVKWFVYPPFFQVKTLEKKNLPGTECTLTLSRSRDFQRASRQKPKLFCWAGICKYLWLPQLAFVGKHGARGGEVGVICTLALKSSIRARRASLRRCCYWLQWVRQAGTQLFCFHGTLFIGWG